MSGYVGVCRCGCQGMWVCVGGCVRVCGCVMLERVTAMSSTSSSPRPFPTLTDWTMSP